MSGLLSPILVRHLQEIERRGGREGGREDVPVIPLSL